MRWYNGLTQQRTFQSLLTPFFTPHFANRPSRAVPRTVSEHQKTPSQDCKLTSSLPRLALLSSYLCRSTALDAPTSPSRLLRSLPAGATTARLTLASVVNTTALLTPSALYSSAGTSGSIRRTRLCLGDGGLRRSKGEAESDGAVSEMEKSDETPQRRRRGRPPASAASGRGGNGGKTAARKTSSAAGKRGRPRGSGASSAAAIAASGGSGKPCSSQEEHPFAQTEVVVLDKENIDESDAAQDTEVYSGRYELSHDALCAQTSARLGCPLYAVRFVLTQTKEGATVPFLARYRQGETGRMDESQLRQVLDTAKEVKEVHRRRQFMLHSLESRGLLTPALKAALESMMHVSQLDDAWEPYKERRTSLASRGRAEGLGKYAFALLHFNPGEEESRELLRDLRAVVQRVEDGERLLIAVVAEDIQRSEVVRRRLGEYCRRTTRLACSMVSKPRKKVAKDLQEENFERLKKHFAFYDGKAWSVDRIAAHVVLALQRGEAKGVLQVETTSGPKSHGLFMHTVREEFPNVARLLPPPTDRGEASNNTAAGGAATSGGLRDVGYCRHILLSGMQGAYDYLLKQLSMAIRRDLKKSAEQEAIAVFAHNLHHMLLQRPLSHSRILAMDPGHAHGVKCVVLDEHGGVETFFTCTLMDEVKMRQYLTQVVEERHLNKIVIGNGTASGETSELVADLIKKRKWKDVEFAVVSEAGASVYSVSDIAKEEFPTLGVMYRGAVSIGRRVLDPLSELVKIPVRSMGIGMYQHDVNEKELMKELGYVLESCVAKVGINAISANRYVMEKVPGIQKKIVDQIVLARHAKKLHSREDLRRVPAMTEGVYEQIAGFFRFPNSPEPLDNTNIHPESYPLVRHLGKLYAAGALTPAAVNNNDKYSGEGTAIAAAAKVIDSGSASADDGGADVSDARTRQGVAQALQQLSPAQLATLASQQLSCTVETLELVTQELLNPGLDPRASLPHAGLLRREVYDVRDLRKGDVLSGVVQSVTMFGAFVDCGLHDSVLVRGEGVDTLQVGAYLHKRIRFDMLDQLNRPRMFLLPDPTEAADRSGFGAGDAGRTRRLRLESEDLLSSSSSEQGGAARRSGYSDDAVEDRMPHGGEVSTTALPASAAPQSLSATILRARKRRAEEGQNSNRRKIIPGRATGRSALGSAAPAATPVMSVELHQETPEENVVSPPPASDAERRGQKRRRSLSPESPRTQPHLNVQQQQLAHPLLQPSAKDHKPLVAPLMAAAKGRAAPRTVLVMGTISASPATGTVETRAKEQRASAATAKVSKPVGTRPGAVDVDAESVDSQPGRSSSSDVVLSF